MRRRPINLLLVTCLLILHGLPFVSTSDAADAGGGLRLHTRRQVRDADDSDVYRPVFQTVEWDPEKTAIVICDMWDKHWCPSATERVAEMAPRMNEVVKAARKKGVLIIHCPSNTLDFYKDTPQRKLAQSAPPAKPLVPLKNWCHLDPDHEAPLPIDDADGGCDGCGDCETYQAWTRQIAAIEIHEGDAITDSAEAYNLMQDRGIDNVIVMGVHTNMCVLGRPFSIRQMVYQQKNVVLVRDMTDTMYNSQRPPFVSHFTGTDLVVEHIERHWCPTVASGDFLAGGEFRFAADKRPHLVMVIAESEYRTRETLPVFARKFLGRDFKVSYVMADPEVRNDLPGIEVLNDADLALISVRRRVLPEAQMKVIRKFVASGKPLIGIRTASHAFALRRQSPPEGYADWPEFDHRVIGGNYHNHHPNPKSPERRTRAWVLPEAKNHPMTAGLPEEEFVVFGSLYVNIPLREGAVELLRGRVPGIEQPEPVAWTFKRPDGGKTFYTSLGHWDDFDVPAFQQLLRNGIYWAAGVEPSPVRTEKTATGS